MSDELPVQVRRYLDKAASKGPWRLEGADVQGVQGAVVIPSFSEGESLFQTLDSLSRNPQHVLERFLVVVVVNHGEGAGDDPRRQNAEDLAKLRTYSGSSPLTLAWVDAVSPGLEMPAKLAGVGFARKLGMDLALARLDWTNDPLLLCLDADTLVEDRYLREIVRHFDTSQSGAAVLPFRHQPAQSEVQQAAIDRYELFLRSYVFGLRLAESPYAFHSVGSTIACRGAAYVRCGGMSHRKAGEDFYFLQKVAKTDGVARLSGTVVYPSPRPSDRTPFGTGRSVARLLDGDPHGALFYPAEVFKVLAEWLRLVANHSMSDAETLLCGARSICPVLAGYLEESCWQKHWPVMQKTYRGKERLLGAFHVWFDGFKSLRLIHRLCEERHRRGEPEELLADFFAWAGLPSPASPAEALAQLRIRDGS